MLNVHTETTYVLLGEWGVGGGGGGGGTNDSIALHSGPQRPWTCMGGLGRVVNSLDFCPASLKSLGCFYFRCVLPSQWKAVTVNLQILQCQL